MPKPINYAQKGARVLLPDRAAMKAIVKGPQSLTNLSRYTPLQPGGPTPVSILTQYPQYKGTL